MDQKKVKWAHVQQLDGIYQGTITYSYKKQGFGIFMDYNFDTYLGYWRNNLLHGLGLIVFRNGTMMYTHFNRNNPDSLRVIKLKDKLVVGTFVKNQIHGIGFQYQFQGFRWSMNRYEMGEVVEELGSDIDKIFTEPPSIMTIEQSLYKLCEGFMKKSIFVEQSETYYTEEDQEQRLGLVLDGKMEGLGIVIRNSEVVQAGVFYNGLMDGYCLNASESYYEVGFFSEGERNGVVEITSPEDKSVFVYQNNIQMREIEGKSAQTALKQTIRDRRQTQFGFLNVKNNLRLNDLYISGVAPNNIMNYRAKYSKSNKSLAKSLLPKSNQLQTPKNRYFKYSNNKELNSKEENDADMSCVEFVKRNAHIFLGEQERLRKISLESLENEEEVAIEENPLMW